LENFKVWAASLHALALSNFYSYYNKRWGRAIRKETSPIRGKSKAEGGVKKIATYPFDHKGLKQRGVSTPALALLSLSLSLFIL